VTRPDRPKRATLWRRALYIVRRSPLAIVGLVLVLLIIVMAVFAPWIAPYDPERVDLSQAFQPPSLKHLCGTDDMGQDVFSRIVYGSRVSLMVAFVVVGIAAIVGTLLGLISGFFGGVIDMVIMRVVDVFLAVPSFVLAMVGAAALGPSIINVMLALSIVWWTWHARIVRGEVLKLRSTEFMVSLRSMGARTPRILFRHLLPNCVGPIAVQTIGICRPHLGRALLSWLGCPATHPRVGSHGQRWPVVPAGELVDDHVSGLDDLPPRHGVHPAGGHNSRRGIAGHPMTRASMPETQPLLDVDDLRTYFFTYRGIVRAVDGVSFSLGRSDAVGLVGETGCGKSVATRSILRLVTPPGRIVSGRVVFDGQDILAMRERDVRNEIRGRGIAMVFQKPMSSLNPVFRVGEQFTSVLRLHHHLKRDEARAMAIESLAAVALPAPGEILRMYPHELSGGMQQRVLIAMALGCRAKLLIADEPTTALDVSVQLQILKLLEEIRHRTAMAILVISHNLGVVSNLCDRVVVMYAGTASISP
jgi:peptide/nickel transport system permease protein